MAHYPAHLAALPDDYRRLAAVDQARALLRAKGADAALYLSLRAQARRCADYVRTQHDQGTSGR
jgi:hypothetical protein